MLKIFKTKVANSCLKGAKTIMHAKFMIAIPGNTVDIIAV